MANHVRDFYSIFNRRAVKYSKDKYIVFSYFFSLTQIEFACVRWKEREGGRKSVREKESWRISPEERRKCVDKYELN